MGGQIPHHPWLSIWVKPRETIHRLVQFNPKHRFVLLSWIYGFPILLRAAQASSWGFDLPITIIFLIALLVAPLLGMLGIVVQTALYTWTGKLFKGHAPFLHVRAAVSWSMVPDVVGGILWLLMIFCFGQNLFLATFWDGFLGAQPWGVAQYMGLVFLLGTFAMSIWSLVIFLISYSEVQGFSVGRAILNFLLVMLIMVGIFALLGRFIGLFAGQ